MRRHVRRYGRGESVGSPNRPRKVARGSGVASSISQGEAQIRSPALAHHRGRGSKVVAVARWRRAKVLLWEKNENTHGRNRGYLENGGIRHCVFLREKGTLVVNE